MLPLPDLFPPDAPEYIERSPKLAASHHKAMDAIGHCRTGASGSSLSAGGSGGPHHHIAHACGKRHWPPGQPHQAAPWWHRQLDQQLPGPYFLITCTVPEALRPLCRSRSRLAYQPLVSASSQALQRLAKEPRFLGTTLPGFTGLLHTWGRPLP
jgi:Transposase zinc-binding domain